MAFSPGYDATVSFGGTDISAFTKSVKSSPSRTDYKLPVLGGGSVRRMVGPTATEYDIDGFLDPSVVSLFSAKMAETTPTTASFSYAPQGSGGSTQSANVFLVSFTIDTSSEGPATFTVKVVSDGVVTFG